MYFIPFKPTACAAAVLVCCQAMAQQSEPASQLPTTIVTATRFAEADPRIPANISVITPEEIAQTPSLGLPDLLQHHAGLDVRGLYGVMGIDAAVDLRGFGDTAGSNTLVLLDGRRLNAIDSSGINWSAIPTSSIERVEIVRGSGSVLYGDRASGGVINLISRQKASSASVTATVGSNNYLAVDAALGAALQDSYLNLAAHYADTDGWRNNSAARQQSLSGRAGVTTGPGQTLFLDYSVYADRNGLPGYLLPNDYRHNPTKARTPFDKQQRDGYTVRPGVALQLAPNLMLEAEAAYDQQHYRADNVSFGSVYNRDNQTTSVTPRLRWSHGLGTLASSTVAGFDYYDGEVASRFSSAAAQAAQQTSKAIYLQNTTDLSDAWSVTTGFRRQQMEQGAHQDAYPLYGTIALTEGAKRARNAWDVGTTYSVGNWRGYMRTGATFRFANTDELFAYDPISGNPTFAGNLRPQHGKTSELGASYCDDGLTARASLFRTTLTDEIGFDSGTSTNINLDPTRRQGIEVEADVPLAKNLTLRSAYAYTGATFREGVYSGKSVPLVARNSGSLQLIWDAATLGRYSIAARYVGDRRFSGDYANRHGQLAGYTTVDLRADWDFKPWQITARVLNAFDQRYAPFAGYSTYINSAYYYPADGRALFVSARYAFN